MNSDTPPENWICATGSRWRCSGSVRSRLTPCAAGRAAAHRLEQPVRHRAASDARLIEREHARRVAVRAELAGRSAGRPSSTRRIVPSASRQIEPRADIDARRRRSPCRRRTPRSSRCRRRRRRSSPRIRRGSSAPPRPSRRPPSRSPGCRRPTPRPACRPPWRTARRSRARSLRCTATPVRISAPVSISSGSTLASAYSLRMNAPSASASMVLSAE